MPKGDFTRLTFDPKKNYSAVHLQQGRVALDADWNEQVAIDGHLRETALADLVGQSGAPITGGGFKILPAPPDGTDLVITPGRYFVDGLQVEAESGSQVGIRASTQLPPSPWIGVSTVEFRAAEIKVGDCVEVFGQPARHLGLTYVRILEIPPVSPGASDQAIRLSQAFYQDRGTGPLWMRRVGTYLHQPYRSGQALPTREGTYLVYLDVWKRHVTALEDPNIRDVALGGPDTATRSQTVCQVKLLGVPSSSDSPVHCLSEPAEWLATIAPSSGRLRARTSPPSQPASPCVVPSDAGYTLLENQLYRVEIHRTEGETTFKWSRDNGTVLTAWLAPEEGDVTNPNRIHVANLGRDDVLGFDKGQWIELTDDTRDLEGRHGLLVKISDIQGGTLVIDPLGQTVNRADFPLNPKVRRWDHAATAGKDGISAELDGWIPLEGSLEIAFDFDQGGTLRSGDHWLIPARAFIGEHHGSIEWPQDAEGEPLALRPLGIHHHYARLAVVEYRSRFEPPPDAERPNPKVQEPTPPIDRPFPTISPIFLGASDCRRLFPALTELLSITSAGGDGQEALPGNELLCPIEVAVTNGQWPVEGALVRFYTGQGRLRTVEEYGALAQSGDFVQPRTGPEGIARCWWQLPQEYSTPLDCLTVTATLLDVAEEPLMAPASLQFHANLSLASQVAYSPGACTHLPGVSTVEEALDALCANIDLAYVSGDHQSGRVGETLWYPLRVRVSNGRSGHLGAAVFFQIENSSGNEKGSGILSDGSDPSNVGSGIRVHTDYQGLAECYWTLGSSLQVSARLVGPRPNVDFTSDAVMYFRANLIPPRRFYVVAVTLANGRADLRNDSPVSYTDLAAGIDIYCSEDVDPRSFGDPGFSEYPRDPGPLEGIPPGKPTCFVTLDVSLTPYEDLCFHSVILNAEVSVKGSVIHWKPVDNAVERFSGPFRRAHLTLVGNFIWTADPESPRAYLDGETFGQRALEDEDHRTDLVDFGLFDPGPFDAKARPGLTPSRGVVIPFPHEIFILSGDRRGGGNFEMWFWLERVDSSLPGPTPAPDVITKRSLVGIKGLGSVFRSRLEPVGINHADELTALEPARLAEVLKISVSRAKTLIENARQAAAIPDAAQEPPLAMDSIDPQPTEPTQKRSTATKKLAETRKRPRG